MVPGLSDTDFYMLVRDEVLGDIPSRVLFERNLNYIVEDVSQRWPKNIPSIRVVPLEQLSTNPVGSFLTGVDARLLLGPEVLGRVSPPSSSDLSRFGATEFDRFSSYWERRTDEGRVSSNLPQEAAYQQYVVLKLAQTALLTRRILKVRKQEIADSFTNEFTDFSLAHIIDQAQRMRVTWPRPFREDMRSFVSEAVLFPKALRSYLLAKSQFHP